jgi:hypothetical protein
MSIDVGKLQHAFNRLKGVTQKISGVDKFREKGASGVIAKV